MRVVNLLCLQPFHVKRKMIRYLLPVEYSVYHVTAKQTHLYLVTCMRVDLIVLVNRLEYVWRRWSVWKLQVVKGLLVYWQFVALLKIFYWHVLQNYRYLAVSILEKKMSLHVFLLHLTHKFLELWSFHAFMPTFWVDVDFSQRLGHFSIVETVKKRIREEDICFQQIKFGS